MRVRRYDVGRSKNVCESITKTFLCQMRDIERCQKRCLTLLLSHSAAIIAFPTDYKDATIFHGLDAILAMSQLGKWGMALNKVTCIQRNIESE